MPRTIVFLLAGLLTYSDYKPPSRFSFSCAKKNLSPIGHLQKQVTVALLVAAYYPNLLGSELTAADTVADFHGIPYYLKVHITPLEPIHGQK